ncbi:MAG: C-terminal helicase domain-containing protein, partial [Bacteroidota bacterium]|nr:C-terminal helicase domain-containing protein [Bacteroidota bacterium]
ADAIHGNKTQSARQNALSNFKSGRLKVLVATDIAARGIDVDDLTHVINFDLPNVPETYVHRIGRTGRAGNSGTALSFCDSEERAFLKDINKLIGAKIPAEAHPFEKVWGDERPAKPTAINSRANHRPNTGRSVQNGAKNTFHIRGN